MKLNITATPRAEEMIAELAEWWDEKRPDATELRVREIVPVPFPGGKHVLRVHAVREVAWRSSSKERFSVGLSRNLSKVYVRIDI